MKLIVGLGNVGKKYQNTKHNIGFMVLDRVTEKLGLEFNQKKFGGLYVETVIEGEKIIFLKPQNYINLSGEVLKKYIDYFKVKTSDILVINDDIDLPIGKYKLKIRGGTAGHNGLKSIEENLGTKNYKRLRIGISKNSKIDTKKYVLSSFSVNEKKIIDEVLTAAVYIVLDYLELDFLILMNKYNKKT
ncbi:MAG: aminoacyl-tRNA hydrolase [Bacilli bacterium]|jgi:PTH1 family peptidyl-tRNA hydrolase|nr:aminoacyl-tRNA hydrolase [Bacilli bacterium]